MNESYQNLVTKIEGFIKKYYINRLMKGILYSLFLLALLFLVLNAIEYFAYLPTTFRLVAFYSYMLTALFVVFRHVAVPVYKLLAYRKSMPLESAAIEIGKHFPEVEDKLLNTLQLKKLTDTLSREDNLLLAGIEQKIARLNPVPFASAIDLGRSFKAMRFFLVPIALLLLLFLLFPSFVKEPSSRLVNYNTVYVKPLPYTLEILNTNFEAIQHEDFELRIRASGQEIPTQISVVAGASRYQMKRENATNFSYIFRKLTNDISFRIEAPGYVSPDYTIRVLPSPLLVAYNAEVVYPAYTQRGREQFNDLTRLVVPAGTVIDWNFTTRDTDSLFLQHDGEEKFSLKRSGKSSWKLQQTALKRMDYSVRPVNEHTAEGAEIQFVVEVIPDEYPQIEVAQVDKDNFGVNRFYTGFIADDYGFTRLRFSYSISRPEQQQSSAPLYVPLVVDRQKLNQQFYHYFSADSINAQPGDRIDYYFEVWDNDAVMGPKSSRSPVFTMEILSLNQLDSISKQRETSIARQMEDMLRESTELRRELDDFRRDLMQKRDIDWSDRNKLKNLLEKQKNLQQQKSDLQTERDQLNQFDRENQLVNERLLEKQEQINKLLEEVIPDDILKMMEEIQQLINELNRDQVQEMLENMRMNNEQFEQMLDRNLSLLKQLQVEKAMMDLISDLEQLAESLEQLGDETQQASGEDNEGLKEQLEEISESFEEGMQRLDSLRNENKSLQRPFRLGDTSEDQKEISKDMKEAGEKLEENKNRQSGQQQKNAAGKMQKMKSDLATMMMRSQQQQQAEDARSMRILLENIVRSSLHQEDIMDILRNMRRDDPAYVDVIRDQSELRQAFRIVHDSLTALSKRQPMIENFILSETEVVTRRMSEALSAMQDRKTAEALDGQQFSMMSLNNLGLMLAEALKNLQESMGMPSPMQGEGECSGSSPSDQIQNMRELQEGLGQQMKDMMERGQQGQQGQPQSMSEEIARMAAEQEAIRQQLQNFLNDLKSQGEGGQALQEIILEMDKLEEDLVNRRLNQELLNRQEDIIVRLLESEKAERERELDEQRQSNEFLGDFFSNPTEFLEYKRLIEKQRDELRLSPVELQPFFRSRVNAYFLRTSETNTND